MSIDVAPVHGSLAFKEVSHCHLFLHCNVVCSGLAPVPIHTSGTSVLAYSEGMISTGN